MRQMKKLITVVLAVALALYPQMAVLYGTAFDLGIDEAIGSFITSVRAELTSTDAPTSGEGWSVEDGVLTIGGVTRISNYDMADVPWSAHIPNIHTLVIEDGVKTIGKSAFKNHTALTNVTIASSVTTLYNEAFAGCTALEAVYVTDLDCWVQIAFYDIYSNPLYFAHNLYENGTLITDPMISEGVTRVNKFAFAGCRDLRSIELPFSLTHIGSECFAGCSSLERLVVPFVGFNSNDKSSFYLGQWFGKEEYENSTAVSQNGTTYYFPAGLTEVTVTAADSLSPHVFYNTAIPIINLPDHMTSIGRFSFTGSTLPEEFELPSMLTTIDEYAFYGCKLPENFMLPSTLTTIGNFAFSKSSLTQITIPESVTTISKYAFESCNSLTHIYMEDGLTEEGFAVIGPYAFSGCAKLSYIQFSNTLKWIESDAFQNCDALKTVTIPSNVTGLGTYAFAYCDALEHISVQASINVLTQQLCYKCPSLRSFEIADNITEIGYEAFYGCDALTEVVIPGTVKKVGSSAFYGCNNLQYITLEEGVEELGNSAFGAANPLRVILPESLTTVGSNCFRIYSGVPIGVFYYMGTEEQFEALTNNGTIVHPTRTFYEVDTDYVLDGYSLYSLDGKTLHCYGGTSESYLIPETFESVDTEAFCRMEALKTLYWPSSMPVIGENVLAEILFGGSRESLQTLYLPVTVTAIADNALKCRDSLTDIYYAGSEEQWNAITIGTTGNTILETATIHFNSDFVIEDDIVWNTDKTELIYFGKNTDTYTFPESLQTIRKDAFAKNQTLRSVCFHEDGAITTVPANLLSGCESVKTVYIPLTVTAIDSAAFEGVENLTVYYQGDKLQWVALGKGANVSQVNLEHQHIFGEWTTLVPAENGADAVEHAFCIDCGYEKLVTVAADHKHAYEKSVLYEPSCTMEGCNRYVCGCGLEYTEVIDPRGHDFTVLVTDEWHRVSEANCSHGELYLYECSVCHAFSGNDLVYEMGEAIPDAHEWDEGYLSQNATCSEEGVYLYTCRHNIEHTYEMNIGTDSTVHLDTVQTEAVEQTCTQPGYTAGVYCNDCETYIDGHIELPAFNHAFAYDVDAVAGSCCAYGYTAGVYCEDCDTYLSGHEELPMDEDHHLTVFGVGERPATCTTAGCTAGTYCNDCKAIISGCEEIPALNHPDTEETPGVAPTETESGYTDMVYCHACNSYIKESVFLPAVQDSFTNSDAAWRHGGFIVATSGMTVAQLLAQTYEDAIVSDADGNIAAEDAGVSTDMTVSFGNTVYFTVRIAGDIDGDDNVNTLDVRSLLRLFVDSKETEAVLAVGDVDGNGRLTTADARLIIKNILHNG